MDAASIRDLYLKRGPEIFPPGQHGRLTDLVHYVYERGALEAILGEHLGEKLFGESRLRLCVPAFEGKHSEVYVFKTPHHEDYRTDRFEKMVTVALATTAAPTYLKPLEHGGYILVDGGVWANNPIMLGVVEALISFDLSRDQIEVLSIGCGDDPYVVSEDQINKGGYWHWRTAIFAAMRLQSLSVTNQARLLLGPPKVVRIDPPQFTPAIALDDCARAAELLPSAAEAAIHSASDRLLQFFKSPALEYVPHPIPEKTP
jgi:hypothetical protein